MPLALLVLFVCVPVLELYVIWQVGGAIGILPTLGVLVLDSVLGTLLMRSQGRAAWRRFNEAIGAGRVPAREVIDGALVILGGAFLLTPGFVTDLLGLALLIPPSRSVVRRMLVRHFAGGMVAPVPAEPPGQGPLPFGMSDNRPAGNPRDPRGSDVDGTATEIDPRRQQP